MVVPIRKDKRDWVGCSNYHSRWLYCWDEDCCRSFLKLVDLSL